MSDAIEENNIYKLWVWTSDTTNGETDLVKGDNIFIYQRMYERGGLFRSKRRRPEGKNIAK